MACLVCHIVLLGVVVEIDWFHCILLVYLYVLVYVSLFLCNSLVCLLVGSLVSSFRGLVLSLSI